jgi:hypothetical protein
MSTPREIVENIQREFGVGLHTDDITNQVIKDNMNRLNRALEMLSEDLYSKETHFILELIQNAEDNEYADGVTPLLKFIVDDQKIVVQNNEKGFTEQNVRALCDVGKTTKEKKGRRGYIGEKGIGFKSVFRVTNTPQIFSNGFQFEFKRKDEPGKPRFIFPYWVEEVPEFVDNKITNIVLPLKEEVNRSELLGKFDEIEPVLILFLRKLKKIEIHDRTRNKVKIITRKEWNDYN